MTVYGQECTDRISSTVNEPFTISKGEKKIIPFSFRIPLDIPMTIQDPRSHKNIPPVCIKTDVDVINANDLKDKDYISILPTKVYDNIIEEIKVIGFHFRQMESQAVPNGIHIQADRLFNN